MGDSIEKEMQFNIDTLVVNNQTKFHGIKRPVLFVLTGTAHCANMYPARSSDLPQLVEARKDIQHHIMTWLKHD